MSRTCIALQSHRLAPACLALALALLGACTTSPTGRQQFTVMPSSVMSTLGATAFQDIKRSQRETSDGFASAYVSCVADGILRRLPPQDSDENWEVVVFDNGDANAFALPGGKIGVNTGMLKAAEDQHQLAAVIGHEIGHVLSRHANERMSGSYAAEISLSILSSAIGGADKDRVMGLLGLGASYGVLLPYNRQRESEADVLGLQLMVRAGFDPNASVALWQNMAEIHPNSRPQFMSTHPSHGTRIAGLQHHIPQVMNQYNAAVAEGYQPECDRIRPVG